MVGAVVAIAIAAIALWWWRAGGGSSAPAPRAAPGSSAHAAAPGGRRPRLDPATLRRGSLAGTVRVGTTPITSADVCATGEAPGVDAELLRDPICTRSRADGTFVIDGLFPARYVIAASSSAFGHGVHRPRGDRTQLHVPLAAGEAKRDIDIQLDSGASAITGTVSDVTGGPIAHARVLAFVGRGRHRYRTPPVETDDEGRFRLVAGKGDAQVVASADGYADDVDMLSAPGFIALQLTPASSLTGTVIDAATRAPVEGARVVVNASDTSSFFASNDAVITDAAGRFRVTRLVPNRYVAVARTERGYGTSAGSTLVALGQHVDGMVIELHPALRVSGTVIDATTRAPCAAPTGTLVQQDGDHSATLFHQLDGTLAADGVVPGIYDVRVRCPGLVADAPPAPLVVLTGDVLDQVWALSPAATLRGRVLDAAGRAVADAQLMGRMTDGSDPRARRAIVLGGSGPDGAYELTGLRPGPWKLSASHPDHAPLYLQAPIAIAAGATVTHDLVLPASSSIAGTVTDAAGRPVPGVGIELKSEAGYTLGLTAATTDASGGFVVTGVAPGAWRVRAMRSWGTPLRAPGAADAEAAVDVKVTASARITANIVVERTSGSIAGRVTDAAGRAVTDAYVVATRERYRDGPVPRAVARWGHDQQAITATDGTFRVTGLPESRFTLHAFRKGGGEAFVEHVDTGATGVVLTILGTGSISGMVRRADGLPDALEVTAIDAMAGFSRTERFFRNGGRYQLSDLPAGDYHITATTAGGSRSIDLDLAPGQHRTGVDITLDPLITLTGRIVEAGTSTPVPRVHVSAELAVGTDPSEIRVESIDPTAITGNDGRFRVSNVPVGSLVIRGIPRGTSPYADLELTRTVSGSGTVDIGDLSISRQ